jgi:holliday junction DNA helicase RuvA
MISYLEGTIKFKSITYLTLLVAGVGYKVFVPGNILSKTIIDQPASFFIHTHVKEDALNLYGFSSQDELLLFEMLLGVSGVGPKTALGIFAGNTINQIKEAIVKGDVSFFTAIPRLGTKNAQKIIIELRGKLGSLEEIDLTGDPNETKEIIDALKTFGFKTEEAKEALKEIKDKEGTVSEKIRQALKILGGK